MWRELDLSWRKRCFRNGFGVALKSNKLHLLPFLVLSYLGKFHSVYFSLFICSIWRGIETLADVETPFTSAYKAVHGKVWRNSTCFFVHKRSMACHSIYFKLFFMVVRKSQAVLEKYVVVFCFMHFEMEVYVFCVYWDLKVGHITEYVPRCHALFRFPWIYHTDICISFCIKSCHALMRIA